MMKDLERSFYIHNLIRLLIPMLIPIIILGSLAIFLIHLHLKEKINQENLNLLNHIQTNVNLIFDHMETINLSIVASAGEFIDLQNMLQKEWLNSEDQRKLATLKNIIDSPNIAYQYIDSIYIYIENDQGHFISSTTGGMIDVANFEDTSWFQSYQNNKSEESTWTEKRTIQRKPENFSPKNLDVITLFRTFTLANGDLGVIVLNVDTSYLDQHLNTFKRMDGQNIVVIDNRNQVLFKKQPIPFSVDNLNSMVSSSETMYTNKIQNEPTTVFKLESEKYGWLFFSTIPNASLYKVPYQLSIITLLLLIASIIAGGILAFKLTKKDLYTVRSIIDILDKAEKGEELPHLPSRINNIHTYIIDKILLNFMEKSYMTILLSERKYKMQALELAVHQSQLNPHFLFNTLETINWRVIGLTKAPNEINGMIENLANILRYSLDAQNNLVYLKEEIKNTKSYIDIQKVRYKDQFDVVWDSHDQVEKYNVVKLILQPLIENCLHHGLVDSRKLIIQIKFNRSQSNLYISVVDNGRGIEAEKLADIQAKMKSNSCSTDHIGLYNTHKRLQLTYGDDYGMTIQSEPHSETVITIKMPIN